MRARVPGEITQGTLLGGRVRYAQPSAGYRTGIEPVLLAASIPAQPGQRVLEAGTGAGAGLLCLAARVSGLSATGLEIDPAQADLARANFAANGLPGCEVVCADIGAWSGPAAYDHAFANPPWHDAAGTASADPGRRLAKSAAPGLLATWAACLAGALRPRGTLSLILPARLLGEGVLALARASCGGLVLLPLWSREGEDARLVILRGTKSAKGPATIRPGLVLHQADGAYTAAADSILRCGEALC